jgi:hypothetical protein
LEIPNQWRIKAADCLRLSREANTLESRSHWASMAEFWFRMAKQVEDRVAVVSVDPAVVDFLFNSKGGSG